MESVPTTEIKLMQIISSFKNWHFPIRVGANHQHTWFFHLQLVSERGFNLEMTLKLFNCNGKLALTIIEIVRHSEE